MDTPTLLTKGQVLTNVAGTTQGTASVSPAANKVVFVNAFVSVFSGVPPEVDIPAGHLGLTWTKVVSHVLNYPQARQVLWRGIGAAPTSGAISLQVAAAASATEAFIWEVVEVGGIDPAAPVTQAVPYVGPPVSPTTHSISLAALGSGSPGVIAFWARSNGDSTAAILAATAPYTMLDEALSGSGSNPGALACSYNVSGTTGTTVTSAVDFLRVNGVALELKSPAGGGDTTAPVLSSPTGTQTGASTATVGATTDEGNGTLYAVVTASATQPTVSQIKAGQNDAGAAAAWAGSQAVSSTGAKTLNATGLTPSTTYYAHLVHTDAASNDSNRVSSASFTTSAAPAGGAPVVIFFD